MRKLIITEEEKKSILGLHGIFEQTTDATTQPVLTPAEQKKQEYLKKREAQKAANATRLAPIEAAQKKRIDDWIASNPGKTEKDYWEDVEKRQSGPDAGLSGMEGQGSKKGGSCGAATSLQKSLNGK
jgi:hypothetical protein